MKKINLIVLLLILTGALNWGLWGFFQFDIVAWVFGSNSSAWSRIVYGIIGISGIWGLSFLKKCQGSSQSCRSEKKSSSNKAKGKRAA
tara:strand:+ start:508 stop:771 length:264 start_codon:yes stop_codon:yes gene_type:complete